MTACTQVRVTRSAEDWNFPVNGVPRIMLDVVDRFTKVLGLPLSQFQLLLIFLSFLCPRRTLDGQKRGSFWKPMYLYFVA